MEQGQESCYFAQDEATTYAINFWMNGREEWFGQRVINRGLCYPGCVYSNPCDYFYYCHHHYLWGTLQGRGIWTIHVICKSWKVTFEEKLSAFQDKSFNVWRYFVAKWEFLLEAGGRYLETLVWRKACWTARGRWNQNSRRMQASCVIDLPWQVLFLGIRFEVFGAPGWDSDYHKTVHQITAYTGIILQLRPLTVTCGWFVVKFFCLASWRNRWSFSLPWGMSTAIDF